MRLTAPTSVTVLLRQRAAAGVADCSPTPRKASTGGVSGHFGEHGG